MLTFPTCFFILLSGTQPQGLDSLRDLGLGKVRGKTGNGLRKYNNAKRLENLENESGHGKEKSWNYVISHGILLTLPLNCTKFITFIVTNKKLSSERSRKSAFSDVFC